LFSRIFWSRIELERKREGRVSLFTVMQQWLRTVASTATRKIPDG